MTKSVLHFLKCVAFSRIGRILFVAHLILVVSVLAQKPAVSSDEIGCAEQVDSSLTVSFIAGRKFRYPYESKLFQILFFLDLLGLLLGAAISWLLSPLISQSCVYTASWIVAVILFIGTSIQWWLVGYCADEWRQAKTKI